MGLRVYDLGGDGGLRGEGVIRVYHGLRYDGSLFSLNLGYPANMGGWWVRARTYCRIEGSGFREGRLVMWNYGSEFRDRFVRARMGSWFGVQGRGIGHLGSVEPFGV